MLAVFAAVSLADLHSQLAYRFFVEHKAMPAGRAETPATLGQGFHRTLEYDWQVICLAVNKRHFVDLNVHFLLA